MVMREGRIRRVSEESHELCSHQEMLPKSKIKIRERGQEAFSSGDENHFGFFQTFISQNNRGKTKIYTWLLLASPSEHQQGSQQENAFSIYT